MSYDINNFFGSTPNPGQSYADIAISGDHRSGNFTWVPDPYLPVVYQDERDTTVRASMLAGRFVSVGNRVAVNPGSSRQRSLTNTDQTALTLHNGNDLLPIGMTPSKVIAKTNYFTNDGAQVTFAKQAWADVPYIVADNAAHGTVYSGDRLTGFWGTVTSTSVVNPKKVGIPVKFNGRKLYSVATAAASTFALTEAIYPGIQPRVVAMFTGAGAAVTGSVTLSWASTSWTAALPASTVTTVLYEWGQGADQIAGDAVEVLNLARVKDKDTFMSFVKNELDGGLYAPMSSRFNVTAVSAETPSTVTAGRQYRVAYYPVSLYHPVTVEVQGTVVDISGNSTTYSSSDWYTLPTTGRTGLTDFNGDFHDMNPTNGLITIAGNITVTAIRVTYSYITNARTAFAQFDPGVPGLTDGSNLTAGATVSGTTVVPSNPRGIPSFLNLSNVVGQLKLWVR